MAAAGEGNVRVVNSRAYTTRMIAITITRAITIAIAIAIAIGGKVTRKWRLPPGPCVAITV